MKKLIDLTTHIGKRTMLIIILAILIGGFLIVKVSSPKASSSIYQTETAQVGTLVSSISTSGTISTGGSVNITTQASGVVGQVYVKNGDKVSQGQKIADIILDQTSQQKQTAAWSSYLSAQNNLNSAQARLNSLQSALFKANQAFINDKGVTNPVKDDPKYIQENADWLQAEADYKNQQGVIGQAQTALSSAWLTYQQVSPTITAPISGTVSGLNLTVGLPITNQSTSSNTNASSQVGTIKVDQGKIQAVVNLSQVDVVFVQPGQKVTLTLDAFPNKTFTGKVSSIDINGVVSSGVTNYPTTIDFDTSLNTIYPNMSVTAKIITLVKDNVLLVPTVAVQTQNDQSYVRKLVNGQPVETVVEVGQSSDTQSEIITGLKEGDVVITSVNSSTQINSSASPFGGQGLGGLRQGGFGGTNVNRGGNRGG